MLRHLIHVQPLHLTMSNEPSRDPIVELVEAVHSKLPEISRRDHKLAIVAIDHRQSRTKSKGSSDAAEFLIAELHRQKDLVKAEALSGASPCISRHGCKANLSVLQACCVVVGVDPRVEDPYIVVGCNECNQAGDNHRLQVLGLDCE